MAEEILSLIKRSDDVSFAEMSRIKGFKGDLKYSIGDLGDKNIWLWFGISQEAVDALLELRDRIYPVQCHLLVYMADGAYPAIETAKKMVKYKKERWLPVVWKMRKRDNKNE